jgi:DNA-binding GntR family transcriptional regulator
MTPSVSGLPLQLAQQFIEYFHKNDLPVGHRLVMQRLADEFHVSRWPVQQALQILVRHGVVEAQQNKGYRLAAKDGHLNYAEAALGEYEEPDYYMRIAADRLADQLPEHFKEIDLITRYGVTRSQIVQTLNRMSTEGWVERKPGYGWKFLPILRSTEAHEQSYRFRKIIEPAAIMAPTFEVDVEAFARHRKLQRGILDQGMASLSPARLFKFGSEFHEMIVGCSNNPFFLDSLVKLNRLRRLLEYRAMINPTQFIGQCKEHLELLDRLEDGERKEAAEFLEKHLDVVSVRKATILDEDAASSDVVATF